MPSWDIHRLVKEIFRIRSNVDEKLDKPPIPLISHGQWRRITHGPLGLLLCRNSEDVKALLLHVLTDRLLNPLIYGGRHGKRRVRKGV